MPEAGARIAAALVAFEPHLVFFSFVLLTEIPFTLCMLGGFLLVLKAAERNAAPLAIVGGALLGYSILIRPGFFPVFLLSGIGTLGVLFFLKDWGRLRVVALTCSAVLVLLAPWAARMHEVTGVVALSGAGWRNVYTDYVASVRAVEKKTAFHEEKAILEARVGELGFSRVELNSPVSASALRSFSLDELWEHRGTVLKLESALLASFFLHDGYFYEFIRFGFLTERGEGHIPVTFTLLSRGVAGVPAIFEELARQRFIPVLGRLFTLMIFVGMVFGFAVTRDRLRFLLAGVIILSAIAATAIGLGVESRSRLPFEPFMFIFTGAAVAYIMNRTQRHAS